MDEFETKMNETQLTFGSVQEKVNKKSRRIFVIRGLFTTRAEFTKALRRELDYHEEYDLRTIKFHDIVNFIDTKPTIVTLDYLYEDLLDKNGDAYQVEAPIKK